MMQPELPQPSWPFYNVMTPTPNKIGPPLFTMNDFSSFTTTEKSSEASPVPSFSSMLSNDFVEFPACDDELHAGMENFWMDLGGLEPDLGKEIQSIYEYFNVSEASFPSLELSKEDVWSASPSIQYSEDSMDTPTSKPSLTLPGEDMEFDTQLSVHHLLKAYGEATEREQRELADVIIRCLNEKVNPAGGTLERLVFNLSRDIETQGDHYLEEESSKNFDAAFRAFYHIFPYGRFAHIAANSAILEAMPNDAETIHIVDFDMGEGIQWPPMIEAVAHHHRTLKLTSIKWEEDDIVCDNQIYFKETKRHLSEHASLSGLTLQVEEMGIEDLVSEVNKTEKRGGKGEWFAFNCMVGLPHMGRVRSRKLVEEFLRTAKELMASSVDKDLKNRGIITLGDGDACEKLQYCSGYGAFIESHMVHYHALLESMEETFPVYLAEARKAMEILFVAPYASSLAWLKKWEDVKKGCQLQAVKGLDGWRLSKETLVEATEMVQSKQNSYGVRIGGENVNEMVLEWKGTQLVKVSTWTNQS
ncbi:nodulation-signaling pathway 2 protein-like isoform X1 [Tripterygium wilfordii]|uniref:Nodulation-signaling pathway 2 protein-like isoform X1 n=1 Tax=Tripterygium wilfordii TaxID=458696 RepID=A0A7J7DMS5_TRIWF|nr:protein NODULATION SIGNALING PATHWAY 2-like [Tripterygium wilfordii]KAF5747641.1 nodulation-signaling pathway 2 protein-like isoform X1 [Tripterygium wilfordii]